MASTRRLHLGDVGRLVFTWATSALALAFSDILLPDLSASSLWLWVVVAAVGGVVGLVLRPLLTELSALIGWIAVLLVALVGQAIVLYGAMLLVPGIDGTFLAAFIASWVTAAVATFIPAVANDYNLVFLPLAAVAVWDRRDPVVVHLALAGLALWAQPVAFAIDPAVLLGLKVLSTLAVGASLAGRLGERAAVAHVSGGDQPCPAK